MKSINYIIEYFSNKARFKGQLSLPQNINFPITDNCNSKCVMCDVWKTKSNTDISIEQISTIFSNKLFSNVKHIGLSGGEPTLRNDLLDIVNVLLSNLPSLKSLSITTHGYHTDIWEKTLPSINKLCKLKGVEFKLNISIDGKENIHNLNRGIPNAYEKAKKTIYVANKNNITPQIQHTLTHYNFNNINSSLETLKNLSSDFIMRRSVEIARLDNQLTIKSLGSYNKINSVFSDFIINSKLLEYTKNPARRLFYKDLAKRLINGEDRKAPCYYQNEGLVVTPNGDLYHCSISYDKIGNALTSDAYELYFSEKSKILRNKLLNNTCKSCIHDQNGAWNPLDLIFETVQYKNLNLFNKIKKVLVLINEGYRFLKTVQIKSYKINVLTDTFKRCYILGAYGGEHVGDSAILGGVIERLYLKYDVRDFVVFSFRKDRTQLWVDGLLFDENIKVKVVDKEQYLFELSNSNSNDTIIAYAGGPIMELFEDLFVNLRIVNTFRSKGIKYIVEGCGFGPFNTRFGKYLGKKMLYKSNETTLREKVDFRLNYLVKPDPAFDYLFKYKNFFSKYSVDILPKNKNKDKVVMLNLRPLWNKYTTESNLDEINYKVLDTLKNFIEQNPDKYFLYIPFNFDHFGFSDLIPALKLESMLNRSKNFEIVEKEMNFKEIIPYIMLADYAICMRFHACIFASSLGLKTLGIDYSGTGKGKVYGLYEQGKIQDVTSIKSISLNNLNNFIK